jgi:hypothetical protein
MGSAQKGGGTAGRAEREEQNVEEGTREVGANKKRVSARREEDSPDAGLKKLSDGGTDFLREPSKQNCLMNITININIYACL